MSFKWNDKEPIYLQLKEQIRNMILIGELHENEALPSVRQVAAEYQLNPITVSKAWQYLVDEELVEKKRGRGMYVLQNAREKLLKFERDKFLNRDWQKIKIRIKNLQIEPQILIDSLKQMQEEQK